MPLIRSVKYRYYDEFKLLKNALYLHNIQMKSKQGLMMEKWEYISTFLEANVKDKQAKEYIAQTFSKKAKRHSPEAMIPDLNKYGADGWELVHMEPVPNIGRQEDIQFDPYKWTNTYFCVFKREVNPPENLPEMSTQAVEPEVQTPPIQLDPNRIPY